MQNCRGLCRNEPIKLSFGQGRKYTDGWRRCAVCGYTKELKQPTRCYCCNLMMRGNGRYSKTHAHDRDLIVKRY